MQKQQPKLSFNLLLQAIRVDNRGAALNRAEEIISGNGVDWDELYSLAEIHCVKPQLALLLGRIAPGMVPAVFLDRLNGAYRQNLIDQLNYVDDFFKVRNFLDAAGIRMIPFKGFWLAHSAYGNLADRESMDVDVFINPTDLGNIKILMERNGYIAEDIFSKFSVEEIKRRFQEYNFDRTDGGRSRFHIEFHWGICPPGYGMGIRLDDLKSQIIKEKLQGQEINVFTPEAHLLLILLHHGGKDRFIQLKQIYDIACIIKKFKGINWNIIISECKRFDADRLIYVGVNMAAALTGVSIPEDLRAHAESGNIVKLSNSRINSMMRPGHDRNNTSFHYNNWLFRMKTRKGLDTKIKITAATGKELLSRFLPGA
jgi:hypothetical protein